MTSWRLLRTPPAPGAWNMAVDEAILGEVAARRSPPTLRFFAWRPACLSLGYFQPASQADEAACARRGVGLVRRMTGGSAILHDDELTYSVAALDDDPLVSGDVLASYCKIASALALGLRGLGVAAELASPSARCETGKRAVPAPCFVRPSDFELLVHGRKLVGSAQVRRDGAVLQHGALPLDGDVAEIAALLRLTAEEREATRRDLRRHATTLATALGRPAGYVEAEAALVQGFRAAWGVAFEAGDLTLEEDALAQELARYRYAGPPWTNRR